MPLFRYEVADKNGKIMLGAMEAASEEIVRLNLTSKGYRVNGIVPVNPVQVQVNQKTQAVKIERGTSGVSVPPKETTIFLREMATFLTGGMSIFDGLTRVAQQTGDRGMQRIADSMAAKVQAGGKLSDAMAEFPRTFPSHIVGVVAAGELGGFLPAVIGDVALDYELAQRASNRWIQLINKMLWINIIGTILLAPFPIFVFKQGEMDFKSIFMRYLNWTWPHVMIPTAILIAGYYLTAAWLRKPKNRSLAHRWLLAVPEYGRTSKERSLAVFFRILWRLQQAGVLPIQAWDAASRAAENTVIATKLHQQTEAIRSGEKFSNAVAATGCFKSEDKRILAMGEDSGQTVDILQKMAVNYEDAAMSSAGRARWICLRTSILLTIIVSGVALICFALMYKYMFGWVDWFFGNTGQ